MNVWTLVWHRGAASDDVGAANQGCQPSPPR